MMPKSEIHLTIWDFFAARGLRNRTYAENSVRAELPQSSMVLHTHEFEPAPFLPISASVSYA